MSPNVIREDREEGGGEAYPGLEIPVCKVIFMHKLNTFQQLANYFLRSVLCPSWVGTIRDQQSVIAMSRGGFNWFQADATAIDHVDHQINKRLKTQGILLHESFQVSS